MHQRQSSLATYPEEIVGDKDGFSQGAGNNRRWAAG